MAVQEGPAVSFHGFENSGCHVPSCAFPWDVADAAQGPQGSQSSGGKPVAACSWSLDWVVLGSDFRVCVYFTFSHEADQTFENHCSRTFNGHLGWKQPRCISLLF